MEAEPRELCLLNHTSEVSTDDVMRVEGLPVRLTEDEVVVLISLAEQFLRFCLTVPKRAELLDHLIREGHRTAPPGGLRLLE
jgi:hypothetical protein